MAKRNYGQKRTVNSIEARKLTAEQIQGAALDKEEMDVLEGIRARLSHQEIFELTGIPKGTLTNMVRNIIKKVQKVAIAQPEQPPLPTVGPAAVESEVVVGGVRYVPASRLDDVRDSALHTAEITKRLLDMSEYASDNNISLATYVGMIRTHEFDVVTRAFQAQL